MADLRSALRILAGLDELAVVDRPVDPAFEATALLDRLERADRYPAVLFRSVTGHPDWALVGNLFATRAKIAAFLGVAARP